MRRHSSGFLDDSAYFSGGGGGGGAAKFERKSPYAAMMMAKREIQPSPLSAAMRYTNKRLAIFTGISSPC